MSEVTDKILERVRKLLAVANDERANEAERDNALRMATNIMAKYQIDMADVPKEQRERDDPRGRFDTEGWYIPWCNQIRGSIARLFDCRYFQAGKINATRGRHVFVGRASNATTAMLMSDWIVKEALREADRVAGHRLTPAGRSFGMGVSSRLSTRVNEIIASSAKEIKESTGRDLMIIRTDEQSANDEWITAHMKTRPGRALSTKNINSDAYYAGQSHGNKVNLSKQVSASPAPKGIR